jgi:hypothetical protein
VRFLNWGLPITAALVVLLALLFGGSGSSTTTQALKPASDAAPVTADDTDGDGIADSQDPDPYAANNSSHPAKQSPSLDSTSPAPQPTPKRRKPKPSLTACDANIRIKAPQTTCGFAQNVFYGYWMNQHDPGVFADSPGIPAYSPAAGTTFDVSCSGASKLVCRASDGGYVTFSAAAVSAYTVANAEKYAATHELGDVPTPDDSGDQTAPAPSDGGDSDCDPSYKGACLDPNASDYDCEGGSGDGPEYTGPVQVVGDDHYDLDRDGDGTGCDS